MRFGSLGRPRRRWEDNIRMSLREIVWEGVDWMHVAQDRNQWRGPCENSDKPSGFTKGGEFFD
jgi:hypothetical protein